MNHESRNPIVIDLLFYYLNDIYWRFEIPTKVRNSKAKGMTVIRSLSIHVNSFSLVYHVDWACL